MRHALVTVISYLGRSEILKIKINLHLHRYVNTKLQKSKQIDEIWGRSLIQCFMKIRHNNSVLSLEDKGRKRN